LTPSSFINSVRTSHAYRLIGAHLRDVRTLVRPRRAVPATE
jgi:hypothetical protein